MANHALLIGINEYRESPLRGCVNDVTDLADFLRARLDFAPGELTLLLDGRATREAILRELQALVAAVRPGDRALLHFSGHGVQLPSTDAEELDGLDEAICPYDYSWDDLEGSFLRDKDFRRELAKLPADATFVWISDSCHSGTLTKMLFNGGKSDVRPRFLTPPPDVALQVAKLHDRAVKLRTLRRTAEELQLAFLSGCQPEQTSADAFFGGRANGALSYTLLRELEKSDGLQVAWVPLSERISKALALAGFDQRPMLEGVKAQRQRSFLAKPSASGAGSTSSAGSASSSAALAGLPSWFALFAELDRRAAADANFRRDLLAASTAASHELSRKLHIDLTAQRTAEPDNEARSRGGTVVRAFWWGFHIEISHADLQAFLAVAAPINQIAGAIGPVTGPAAPFVMLAAGFIAGALDLLRGLDRGRGVYISMSWFAPGVFVPTSV